MTLYEEIKKSGVSSEVIQELKDEIYEEAISQRRFSDTLCMCKKIVLTLDEKMITLDNAEATFDGSKITFDKIKINFYEGYICFILNDIEWVSLFQHSIYMIDQIHDVEK